MDWALFGKMLWELTTLVILLRLLWRDWQATKVKKELVALRERFTPGSDTRQSLDKTIALL